MRPSRRDLLHGALATGVGLALPRAARAAGPAVVVVGGGPAGLAAALALVEGGARVTLVEARDQVGGRAAGWFEPLPGSSRFEDPAADVERAVHLLPAETPALRLLLERNGLEGVLRPLPPEAIGRRAPGGPTRPGLAGAGERRRLERALRGARGEVADALRGDSGYADLAPLGRRLSRGLHWCEPGALPAATLAADARWQERGLQVLAANPQEWLWQPLARLVEALGGSLRLGSAARAVRVEGGRVVGVELGEPGGSLVVARQGEWSEGRDGEGMPVHVHDGPDGPRAWVGRCGHDGAPVVRDGDGFLCLGEGGRYDGRGRVAAGPPRADLRPLQATATAQGYALELLDSTHAVDADAVVLALPGPALARLLAPVAPALAEGLPRGRSHAVARLWLDRDLPAGPAVVGLDGLAATAVLVHRLQEHARTWAARSRGAVVELHAATAALDGPAAREALLDTLEAELRAAWPELAGATTLHRRLVQGVGFPFLPAAFPGLPPAPLPGLHLAGEAVAGPGPHLLEHAVRTGLEAAQAILAGG